MKKMLISLATVSVLAYAGSCVFLYAAQRGMLYHPTPVYAAPMAEQVLLQSGGETLRIWRVAGEGTRAIIYFGGNAESMAKTVPLMASVFDEHSLYLVNYRGYGGSTGSPSEAGLFTDALTIYDSLAEQYSEISVIGRSLGTGVASYLAAHRQVEKLTLVTPFDSIESLAKANYPAFPVSLILKDKFRSVDYAGAITAPVLFIVAETDQTVPRIHTETLRDQYAPSQVTYRILPGTNHININKLPAYASLLKAFHEKDRTNET